MTESVFLKITRTPRVSSIKTRIKTFHVTSQTLVRWLPPRVSSIKTRIKTYQPAHKSSSLLGSVCPIT